VSVHRRAGAGDYDVVLVFCADSTRLQRRVPALTSVLAPGGGLWICWPKRASGAITDLSDQVVRAFGLARGLVDVKVAAIDATWSGLRFVRRRESGV
jgi:hypothetical protein